MGPRRWRPGAHPRATSSGGAHATTGSAPYALEDIDRVATAARRHGLEGLIDLKPPATAQTAWTVKEAREPYKLHNFSVSVNGATGEVIDTVEYRDGPLAAKLTNWLIQAHMGLLFDLPNQLALGGVAVGIVWIIISGWRMWFLRGGTRLVGRMPKANLNLLSKPQLAGLVAGTLAYSLLAPLFGASLVAFLIIDTAARWTITRMRRGRKIPPAHSTSQPVAVPAGQA